MKISIISKNLQLERKRYSKGKHAKYFILFDKMGTNYAQNANNAKYSIISTFYTKQYIMYK